MYYCYAQSPVGRLLLVGTKQSLHLLSFETSNHHVIPLHNWQFMPEYFSNCVQQLDEYFAGRRQYFDISYTLTGTEFQQNVLKSVAKIKYGQTAAYSTIANRINNPEAVRAVGMANAMNKLPIIIPCHRVIGKNGNLTGFAGGIATKKYLLELESLSSDA